MLQAHSPCKLEHKGGPTACVTSCAGTMHNVLRLHEGSLPLWWRTQPTQDAIRSAREFEVQPRPASASQVRNSACRL
jgi:hypothetical protein